MKSLGEVLDDKRRERIREGMNRLDPEQFRSLILDLLENLGLEVSASVITDDAVRIEATGDEGSYIVTASQRRDVSSMESMRRIREKADFVERLPVLIVTHDLDEESARFAEGNDIALADLSKLLLLFSKFGMEERILSEVDRHILEEEGSRFLPSIGRYDSLVRGAEKDLKEGRSSQALVKLDQAMELKSNQDSVWRMRARALHAMGEEEGALEACRRSTELDSGNAANWYLMALMLHEMNDLEGEIECYDSVLRIEPRNLAALINRGATLFEMGDLEGSLKNFDRMIQLFPRDPRGFKNRALIHREMGVVDKALSDIETAISMAPDDRELLINRASIIRDTSDLDMTMDAWREVLAIDRSRPEIWMELGSLQMEAGLFEEAARSFAVASNLDPELEEAGKRRDEALDAAGIVEDEVSGDLTIFSRYLDGATLLRAIGDPEGALNEVEKGLELEPSNPDALLERGHILLEMGNFEEAIASIGDATRRAVRPDAILDMESLLHRMGRHKECRRMLGKLERVGEAELRGCLLLLEENDPGRALRCVEGIGGGIGLAIQALSALGSDDGDRALLALTELLKEYPNSPWLLNCKGVALRMIGELDPSEEMLRRSVEIEPRYADAWNNLGSILYLKGEYQDAEKCFDQALLVRKLPIYLTNTGACKLALEDLDGARESYLSALRMEQSPEAINGMGIVSERSKDLVRALEFYREAMERAPNFQDARMNLGRVKDILEK